MKLNEYLDELEEYRLNYYRELIKEDELVRRQYKKLKINEVYDSLTKDESKLLKTLVKDADIEKYFAVYFCLLWNGYFSYDKTFDYDNGFRSEETTGNLALNIATGKGCCRHISSHFTNLMNEVQKGNNFILIGTKTGINVEKIPTTEEIERKLKKGKITEARQELNYKFNSNHVESFDDKNNICYDLTKFNITRMNFDNISDDNFTGMYDLGIDNMFGTLKDENKRLKTLEEKVTKSKLLELVKKEYKPEEELRKLRDIGLDICNDNIDLLEEHHNTTNKKYEYIYKRINNR